MTTKQHLPATVRCAVYTRKSTEEGLEKNFSSLDAQREAALAYIQSQRHEGWKCLPVRYDDGGFTGGNMDRPALSRLLADVEAGKIDSVITYKVDRLSRSLLDFARIIGIFEKHHVAFVSVTQQFNSATSMGRLVLNVLLSFAQFEREIISERTRDKIAATRRRGKWSGGLPLLGYDVDPTVPRLVVNPKEAARVRAIFDLYLEHQGLLPVVRELERRGWRTKAWVTRKGRKMGGKPFTKTSLHKFLTNSTCAGKLRYKTELHSGEHPAIVDPHKWQKVQELLHGNRLGGALLTRNGSGAILKGLLRCRPCGCAMTPTHATKGGKRYRYYVCSNAQKRGSDCCPSQSVPAGQMERIVVEQIAKLGQDPERLKTILTEASKQRRTHLVELAEARRSLEQELARAQALTENLRQETGDQKQQPASEQEAIRENIGHVEQRLADTKKQALAFQQRLLDVELAAKALLALDQEFGSLPTIEQARLIRLMVQRVDYDGAQGKLALTLDPAGLATVVVEQIQRNQEAAK
jgi:site-specific DNA recombinase